MNNLDLRRQEEYEQEVRNGPSMHRALDGHIAQQNREMEASIPLEERHMNRIEDVTATLRTNYQAVQQKVDAALQGAPSEPPVPLAEQEPQHQSFTHPLGGGDASLLHHLRSALPQDQQSVIVLLLGTPYRRYCPCGVSLLLFVLLMIWVMGRR